MLACLLMGCKTFPTTDDMAFIAGDATFLGSSWYLADHQDKRPDFAAAKLALDAMIADKNADPIAFQKVLASLPIKEFQGTKGGIVVGEAVSLWSRYSQKVAKLDTQQKVMPIIVAVRDGLARALGSPTAGVNMPRAYEWRGPEPVQRFATAEVTVWQRYQLK